MYATDIQNDSADQFNSARLDKPCGASYIPKNAKCSKGPGKAAQRKPGPNSLRKVKEKKLEESANKILESQIKRYPKKLTEENMKEFSQWRQTQPDTKKFNEIRGEINRRYKARQKVGAVIQGIGAMAAIGGMGVASGMLGRRLNRK